MLWCALLAGCGWFTEPVEPIREPAPVADRITGGSTNVVVVLLDTVRADRLGFHGYPIPTSPHLDAIAEHGAVFERHIANCSWTRPSMGSILTGLHARTLGLYEERYDRLDTSFTLLSERLQRRGYVTLGVTSNPNMNDVFGFDQGFDAYGESGVRFRWMSGSGRAISRDTPLEDAQTMTDRALAIVDAHREPLADQPLYLQVVYIDPHWPYVQPAEHERAVSGSSEPGYDGGIHFIDAEIRRLLDGLAERGLMRDTLFVVTSDHGEGLGSHPDVPNSAMHGTTLYESVLHVPLVLSHPAIAPRRVPAVTEGIDVVPTVLDLLGWPVPADLPGRSLAPALRGEQLPDRDVFAETDFRGHRKVAVRSGDLKWIRNDDVDLWRSGAHEGLRLEPAALKQFTVLPVEELYDVRTGEGPSRPAGPASEADRLRAAVEAWEARTPARAPMNRAPGDVVTLPGGELLPVDGTPAEIDEATRDALQAIGYLE